jgi:peptidoglycan/xylan/chitin deacetylase (PgdA/CDA1 family)
MIRVALRFDDPSATSHHGVEAGVIAALQEIGVPATFAVIPFRDTPAGRLALDASNGAHLLAACRSALIEVALHGHSHRRLSPEGQPSEFSGLTVAHQSALLTEAANHLRGLFGEGSLGGFVPPWNSYDATTLTALEGLGFDYLSAGWKHPPGYAGPLAIVPRTCQFTELESAIAEARRYARFAPCVVAVLHHYDFYESTEAGSTLDLPAFTGRLAWLKRQADVQIMSLRDMVAISSAGAFVRGFRARVRKEHLNWRLQRRLPDYCLVDAPLWRQLLA